MPRGVFISLDGLDGTGKSTQCQLLAERLRRTDLSVTTCTDPGGTELGAKLREILLFGREIGMGATAEALLFMASRAELVERVIRPAILAGHIVISDRYTLANVVYQGHAGGLNPDDIWKVGKITTEGLYPSLTLVLDLPVEMAAVRRGRAADRLESRGADYHQRVRDGFLIEARSDSERIKVIDASLSVEVVQQKIWNEVRELLRSRGFKSVGA